VSTWPSAGPTPEGEETQKRSWFRPRWWWSIPGAVILIGAAVGVVFAGARTPTAVPNHVASQTGASSATGATGNTGSGAVGSGYLATGSNYVVFIQWTMSGNDLSGSAQETTLSGSPPNAAVNTQTISVVGSLNGSTITLSFNGGAEVFGTLSGGSFTVNFPQSDGSLAPVTFTSASASRFNAALNSLKGSTGSANQSAAAAQAIAKQQATIDSDASAVQSDIKGLGDDTSSMQSDLVGFTQVLTQAQTDLDTVAQVEQQVQTEARNGTDPGTVCADEGTDDADAGSVDADAGSVSAQAGSIESDISGVRHDISGLNSDFASLGSAQALQPSYHDGAPNQSAVNQAIAAANAAIASAISASNGDISQASAYVAQAYNDVAGADAAGNCGPPPSQPTTQTTIS
jgi:hypothetical protein